MPFLVIATSRGADPGVCEVEDPLQSINRDQERINSVLVNLGGDFAGNSTKAISAAIAQLLNAAKNNPTGLGSTAKTTASTIPELVDASIVTRSNGSTRKIDLC